PPLSSSLKSHNRRRLWLCSLHQDLWQQSPSVRRSRHRYFSSPSSSCSSLAQAATPRAVSFPSAISLASRRPDLKRADCVCSNWCLSGKLRLSSSHFHEPSRRRHDLPFAWCLLHHTSLLR
uniref:Uncharacterized protein n=1 Tax=Cucumis melo TaxID=3656 RepID=A0A9I9ECM6_CUCME